MSLLSQAFKYLESKLFWVKLGAATIAAVGMFLAGIETQYLVERDRENTAIKAAISAKEYAERELGAAAEAFKKTLADLIDKNRTLTESIHADVAKNPGYRNCRLSPDTIRLLNEQGRS